MKWNAWLVILAAAAAGLARAEDAKIAVAANFTAPAKEIAAAFHTATGDTATLSFGASGQFAAAIRNGAPYDVLLSADSSHVAAVAKAGQTVTGTRFTYATGHLVLWSKNPRLIADSSKILTSGDFQHIAIADPALAPYGLAAEQYLQQAGLWTRLQPRIVTGKSIGQALQFVQSGNAELGFVALSQVIKLKDGSEWKVPDADHAPIIQQAVLLKHGADNQAARKFLQFLKSPRAAAVIRAYGYD